MRWFGSMMRKSELRQLTGASYVLAGSAICSVIFYGDFCGGFLLFMLDSLHSGDAAAALVGKAFGRIRIGENSRGCLGLLSALCFACRVCVPVPARLFGGLGRSA